MKHVLSDHNLSNERPLYNITSLHYSFIDFDQSTSCLRPISTSCIYTSDKILKPYKCLKKKINDVLVYENIKILLYLCRRFCNIYTLCLAPELFKQTYSSNMYGGCHGCDRMVIGFTTTYAISAYHH